MAFRLRACERPAQGLARVAIEQMDLATRVLRPPVDDRDIHRARQSFKRLRAIVRLLKPMLGGRAKSLHVALRQAGRALSPCRDASVIQTTLNQLNIHPPPAIPAACLSPPATLIEDLQAIRCKFDAWSQASLKRKQLAQSFRRTQKRARQARKRALSQGTTDDWHTWRKRVKDLFYQSQCLGSPHSKTRRLARLAKVLGDEHDLSLLESAGENGQKAPAPWQSKLNVRREKLRRCARKLSRSIA